MPLFRDTSCSLKLISEPDFRISMQLQSYAQAHEQLKKLSSNKVLNTHLIILSKKLYLQKEHSPKITQRYLMLQNFCITKKSNLRSLKKLNGIGVIMK